MTNNITDVFRNISGYEDIKRDAYSLVDMFNNEEKYLAYGAHLPKEYLLYGKPGMGKTRIVRAMTAAIKYPTFEISEEIAYKRGTTIQNLIVDSFEEAAQAGKSVIFIDEIDKLAGFHEFEYDVQENLMTRKMLLQAIDKLESASILLIATANSLEYLGQSLLRSGRFDRMTEIHQPNYSDRRQIFDQYMNKAVRSENFDEDTVIRDLSGCSCAILSVLSTKQSFVASPMEAV